MLSTCSFVLNPPLSLGQRLTQFTAKSEISHCAPLLHFGCHGDADSESDPLNAAMFFCIVILLRHETLEINFWLWIRIIFSVADLEIFLLRLIALLLLNLSRFGILCLRPIRFVAVSAVDQKDKENVGEQCRREI